MEEGQFMECFDIPALENMSIVVLLPKQVLDNLQQHIIALENQIIDAQIRIVNLTDRGD